MKRLIARAFLTVALLACAVAPSARAGDESATRYYLSLGDSLAASFQPPFDRGQGYAEQLHATLAAAEPKLKLVKLGCGGETSVTFMVGQPGGCQPRFL